MTTRDAAQYVRIRKYFRLRTLVTLVIDLNSIALSSFTHTLQSLITQMKPSLFPHRLAVGNLQYLSNTLGIKDPIHKQKLALKAMDVVLFGPPKGKHNAKAKDYW